MKMKKIVLTSLLFAAFAFTAHAQTDDYSKYLNKAMEKLEAGDCAGAQKLYNVYKELVGKPVSSVEVLIDDCQRDKPYAVGEKIMLDGEEYRVAYIRDGGKHGLAVMEKGWSVIRGPGGNLYTRYVERKEIPTLKELELIYANRDILRLYGKYWSCTPTREDNHEFFKTIDFSTGQYEDIRPSRSNAIVLLIHRF